MPPKSISILTQNQKMIELITKVDQIVQSDSSILLIGETGVGKELFAEYIHHTSLRQMQPFIKIGLSALPPELLESELFGYEKGAFTSAGNEKKGLFELADSGSIFLDDIDDFPLHLQSKLLRVLESRELMRIGGQISIPINVRLITASKKNLHDLVEKGAFRSDLYYRINVVPIEIPPLRERSEDVPLLIEYFLKKFAPEKTIKIDNQALKKLIFYSWPGNVRELRNVVQRLSLFVQDEIKVKDLPIEIREENPMNTLTKACHLCLNNENMTFEEVVNCLERNLIEQTLKNVNMNKASAAKVLKMNYSTFRDKLKKYNIE